MTASAVNAFWSAKRVSTVIIIMHQSLSSSSAECQQAKAKAKVYQKEQQQTAAQKQPCWPVDLP